MGIRQRVNVGGGKGSSFDGETHARAVSDEEGATTTATVPTNTAPSYRSLPCEKLWVDLSSPIASLDVGLIIYQSESIGIVWV